MKNKRQNMEFEHGFRGYAMLVIVAAIYAASQIYGQNIGVLADSEGRITRPANWGDANKATSTAAGTVKLSSATTTSTAIQLETATGATVLKLPIQAHSNGSIVVATLGGQTANLDGTFANTFFLWMPSTLNANFSRVTHTHSPRHLDFCVTYPLPKFSGGAIDLPAQPDGSLVTDVTLVGVLNGVVVYLHNTADPGNLTATQYRRNKPLVKVRYTKPWPEYIPAVQGSQSIAELSQGNVVTGVTIRVSVEDFFDANLKWADIDWSYALSYAGSPFLVPLLSPQGQPSSCVFSVSPWFPVIPHPIN